MFSNRKDKSNLLTSHYPYNSHLYKLNDELLVCLA